MNYVCVFECYMHCLRIIKALSCQLTVGHSLVICPSHVSLKSAWDEAVLLESFTQTFVLLKIWQSQPCDLPLGLTY